MPVKVMMDGEPVLDCTLVVCKPVAPLTACAGIVALRADSVRKKGGGVAFACCRVGQRSLSQWRWKIGGEAFSVCRRMAPCSHLS